MISIGKSIFSKFKNHRSNSFHNCFAPAPGIDAKHLIISGGIGSGLYENGLILLERAIKNKSIIHFLSISDCVPHIATGLYNRSITHDRSKSFYSNTLGKTPDPFFKSISIDTVNQQRGICLHAVPRESMANINDFSQVLFQLNKSLLDTENSCVIVIHGNTELFTQLKETIIALQELRHVSILLMEYVGFSDYPTAREYSYFFEKGFSHMKLLGGTQGHDETEFTWYPDGVVAKPDNPIKISYKPVKRPYQQVVFANT